MSDEIVTDVYVDPISCRIKAYMQLLDLVYLIRDLECKEEGMKMLEIVRGTIPKEKADVRTIKGGKD